MLPQCEGLGLLHILQVGSAAPQHARGTELREGGVPNGKLNLNMSAAPHTLPILRGVPSRRQTMECHRVFQANIEEYCGKLKNASYSLVSRDGACCKGRHKRHCP